MRQYTTKEVKEVEKIFCNQCCKEIRVVSGRAEEGVFSVDYEWGYFSEKDGEKHSFDLCEACYNKMTAGFLTPIETK